MIEHQSCTGRCETAAGCNCWAGVCAVPIEQRPPTPAEAATELGADEQFEGADREILGFLLRFALALLAIVATAAAASRCAQ